MAITLAFANQSSRVKMMVDKLKLEVDSGRLDNNFAEEFIYSVNARISAGLSLSDKQINKLEELFDKY